MQAQPAEARNWALLLGCQDHQAGRLQQALITVVDKGQRAEGQGRKNRTKGAHRPDTEAKAQNAGFNLGDHKTRPSNSALLLFSASPKPTALNHPVQPDSKRCSREASLGDAVSWVGVPHHLEGTLSCNGELGEPDPTWALQVVE